MKLSFRDIEPFVQKPDPAARVILVYGPDDGLMRERASIMGKTVTPDLSDPFNVVVLSTDILNADPARLSDEANALSMMGGQRLIRIEDAGDKLTPLIKEYLENPNNDAMIMLEAGDLGPRSSLRLLCEKAKNAAAVPCYVDDEKNLGPIIRKSLHDEGYSADNDAVIWLAANISGNRQKVRSELEKLIVYKGSDKSPITMREAQDICGQAGAQSFDDLVYNMGGNNPKAALKAYSTLIDEGTAEIAILRAIQNHFRRLHLARSIMQEGKSAEEAMKALSPPIFFKQEAAFRSQLQRWQMKMLENILSRLADLETQTKQTGMPTETLCAQAILSVSMVR